MPESATLGGMPLSSHIRSRALASSQLLTFHVSSICFGSRTGFRIRAFFCQPHTTSADFIDLPNRYRNPEGEGSAPVRRGRIGIRPYLHRAAVQLDDPVRHGEPDAASLRLRRKVQVEDSRQQRGWNTNTTVGDFNYRRALIATHSYTQRTTFRHSLHCI